MYRVVVYRQWRRFNIGETASSHSDIAAGIYSGDVSKDVYAHLNTVAEMLLAARHNVILDASFLHIEQRRAALGIAERTGSHAVILQTVADDTLLQSRILARQQQQKDASEANTNVLEYQLHNCDPLTDDEQQRTIQCQSHNIDATNLAKRIRKRTK